jgi:tyrosyl-tRNA synthetase
MTFADVIRTAANFTVQQMIQRDMFQKRLKQEKPIYLHEFLYPLAQGYDSVGMDVDLEIGGNDQMFNMMAGRHLQKVINNKEKFVMTLKIFEDDKGTKMGKSEGNAVFMSESPENMYGIIMSWPDGFISPAFELVTTLPLDEVRQLQNELKGDKINPRDLKMRVAREIVKLIHGERAAKKAENQFIKTFQKKETPVEVKSVMLKTKNMNVVDLFKEVGLVSSKGEARRLIEQKGLKVGDKIIENPDEEIEISDEGVILQRGKRQFIKVII